MFMEGLGEVAPQLRERGDLVMCPHGQGDNLHYCELTRGWLWDGSPGPLLLRPGLTAAEGRLLCKQMRGATHPATAGG